MGRGRERKGGTGGGGERMSFATVRTRLTSLLSSL